MAKDKKKPQFLFRPMTVNDTDNIASIICASAAAGANDGEIRKRIELYRAETGLAQHGSVFDEKLLLP
jgi:hypothetical protein